jgi:hypothetical protein
MALAFPAFFACVSMAQALDLARVVALILGCASLPFATLLFALICATLDWWRHRSHARTK